MASPGRPLKALEDDVPDEGVGAVPTTLQGEMMPSGKKIVFCHCQKRLAACGQNITSDKSTSFFYHQP